MKLMFRLEKGFALPSIVLASITMLIVLLSAIQATSSVAQQLREQYYTKLAQTAAESGASYAVACMRANNYTAPWVVAGKKLSPETDCSGTITASGTYVVVNGNIRTTFLVTSLTSTNSYAHIGVTGTTELVRRTGGMVWRSYDQSIVRDISITDLLATSSSSGRYEVCGIIGGDVWCWGHNELGQLGNGTQTDSEIPVKAIRKVGGLLGNTDTDVAVGDGNVCAVSSGEVYCWGSNEYGQLGISTTDADPHPFPTKVSEVNGLSGKTVSQVVTNGTTNCALAAGDVWCWGKGSYGVLGRNTLTMTTVPTKISTIGATYGSPITKITMGPIANHICAIASGKAYCWGRNNYGQLGDNTTTDRLTPVAVYTGGGLAGKTVIDIAADGAYSVSGTQPSTVPDGQGRAHVCAVTSDGGVYCWGTNQYGQLGQGTTSMTPTSQPVVVAGLLNGKVATQVAVSYSTSCALAGGAVYCWGTNNYGQVGDGTNSDRSLPTAVVVTTPGLAGKTVSVITGGVNRQCAVASSVSYCWGANFDGQLGDGTHTDRYIPTEATFLRQPPVLMTY